MDVDSLLPRAVSLHEEVSLGFCSKNSLWTLMEHQREKQLMLQGLCWPGTELHENSQLQMTRSLSVVSGCHSAGRILVSASTPGYWLLKLH